MKSKRDSWNVQWEKRAVKEFEKLPIYIQNRILKKVRLLKENPFLGEELHGEWKGFRKLRIGDYRVVYSLEKAIKVIAIVKVGHCRDIYR